MQRTLLSSTLANLVLPLLLLAQGGASDEEIWADFTKWVESVPARRSVSGTGSIMRAEYQKKLHAQGLSTEEVARWMRVLGPSRDNPERARTWWDAVFKFSTGPSDPLKLLVETIRDRKPGTALDVGMGGGRNALYLASMGWRVTGYDYSPEAILAARENAKRQGLVFNTVQADHESFDFGVERWDVIVLSYVTPWNGLGTEERIWRSLKPGGLIVYQYGVPDQLPSTALLEPWKRYRILRFQDEDDTHEGFQGGGRRVMRLVAQKGP